MKVVLPILCLLVVGGVLYGLAFVGILPAQKWADTNPKLAPMLRAAHLAKLTKPKAGLLTAKASAKAPTARTATPPPVPIAPAPVVAAVPLAAPPPDTHGKLDAIYAAMSPDDLARIFGKLPDPQVIDSLMPMDEKKAGKVLAAMPAARAARLSQRMMARLAVIASNTPAPATALP